MGSHKHYKGGIRDASRRATEREKSMEERKKRRARRLKATVPLPIKLSGNLLEIKFNSEPTQ